MAAQEASVNRQQSREDYEAIKRLMPDEPYLCDTFQQWLEKVNKEITELQASDLVARKTIINHKQFTAYCAQAGQNCNIVMLGAFATVIDRKNYERGE